MRRRKGTRVTGAYARTLREVAGRDAVREAEEVVNASWMLGLLHAENQAATAKKVCAHMCAAAHEVVRAALLSHDPEQFADGCRELAASQRDLTRTTARHEGVREFAAQERAAWTEASQLRAEESLADWYLLAEAARAAGLGPISGPDV